MTPYDGPYLFKNHNSKCFTIIINKKEVYVSIDRLKPAFTDSDISSSDITVSSVLKKHVHFSVNNVSGRRVM